MAPRIRLLPTPGIGLALDGRIGRMSSRAGTSIEPVDPNQAEVSSRNHASGMQHDRIFATDQFWVFVVARPGFGDSNGWVCDVSLYPRASPVGTFHGLAVTETRISGFMDPGPALDEGETLGVRMAERLTDDAAALLSPNRRSVASEGA